MANPLLIDGLKFDLCVYVLITRFRPIRVYVHEDGFARFCTWKYLDSGVEDEEGPKRHLTNYSVNKKNPDFVFNQDAEKDDF
mmetsp:Transcript_26612/g.37073  ORF Transcript_26612/g.37073 Transcript_26612/m.37073 type:complete len:82 (-) Transcript_26612:290-535(-)